MAPFTSCSKALMFRLNLARISFTCLQTCEAGLISISHLAVVLLAAILLAMMLNATTMFTRKVARQSAADAIAQAVAEVHARCLNEITATNHVIGELTSMVIVHNAIAGRSPMNEAIDTMAIDSTLNALSAEALSLGINTLPYAEIHFEIRSKGMVGEAKLRIKNQLTIDYRKMIDGDSSAIASADWLAKEWETLSKWEGRAARDLSRIREILDQGVPRAKRHLDDLVDEVPQTAQTVAEEIGMRNGVRAATTWFDVPVTADPLASAMDLSSIPEAWYADWSNEFCTDCESDRTPIVRKQILKMTQLVRATFPWVLYHRKPILDALEPLTKSEARQIYEHFTHEFTENICDRLQRDEGIWLYVLMNSTTPDKGHERWADDPALADRQFGIIGVAWEPTPSLLRPKSWISVEHANGQLAFAQALLYSANTQRHHPVRIDLTCKRITPNRQAGTGWDTLAWSSMHPPPWEWVQKTDGGSEPRPEYPNIQVNWHAKLVPASKVMLKKLHDDTTLPQFVRRVVDDMFESTPAELLTH